MLKLRPITIFVAFVMATVVAFAQPQQTLDRVLMGRAKLIASIVGETNSKETYWHGYDGKPDLHVDSWGDDFVDYRWRKNRGATIVLSSVQPAGFTDLKESEPVELDSRVIDAASIEVTNAGASTEQVWGPYTAEFETLTTKERSFELGFEQTLTTTGTIGSDASQAKLEISAMLGFSQTTTDTQGEQARQSRVFSFEGVTPAGMNERITAWRKVSRMTSEITGNGDKEHYIRVGHHWHGKWDNSVRWDTYSDFKRTVSGQAPSGWDRSGYFRKNPVSAEVMELLEEPLNVPFLQKLEFDQATSVSLRKESF